MSAFIRRANALALAKPLLCPQYGAESLQRNAAVLAAFAGAPGNGSESVSSPTHAIGALLTFPAMKFRTHLAFMAAGILLPIIVLTSLALLYLMRAEREAAQRGVRETARAVALAVDREIGAAEAALRVLATSRARARAAICRTSTSRRRQRERATVPGSCFSIATPSRS